MQLAVYMQKKDSLYEILIFLPELRDGEVTIAIGNEFQVLTTLFTYFI